MGRVKNVSGMVHRGSANIDGYRRVGIQGKNYLVHRLVARVFHGPPPSTAHTHVNHIDRDKANNAASNLEYVTPSANARHAWAAETQRSARRGNPVRCRPVGMGQWLTFASQLEAALAVGLAPSGVSTCCTGQRQSYGGYEFQVVESKLLSGEVWEEAKYPGLALPIPNLMVSSLGRIKTAAVLATFGTLTGTGYYATSCKIQVAGRKVLQVHRLVAATFLGQPSAPDMHVNHLDGNRGNNHVGNLEYATPAQNVMHAYMRQAGSIAKPNNRRVVLARKLGGMPDWIRFASLCEAASHTGANSSLISRVCRGQRKQASGWEFKFSPAEHLPGEEWRKVMLDWSSAPSETCHKRW